MTSVFAKTTDLFTTYHCAIKMRDRMLGGIPKAPDVIEAWLRSKAGISDTEEVRNAMLRTLKELGVEVKEDMNYEDLVAASKEVAGSKQATGFKVDEEGLYIEDRQVKAMLREAVNILYAGERWGTTKKGPLNYFVERVFIQPAHIHLGRAEPDGTELRVIHISGPQGRRSSLSYFEYVESATMEFDVIVARDLIEHERWPEIWTLAQENGLGASRAQSYGRFDVTKWETAR